ncbi:DUF1289 domain-containing protein [Alloyangia pacifica]|uniref:DUF1289 domain-containing protein n=1 Tax=Alloyangia pacifica TaxID=311180 RepID=A0A2U8HCA5_9RHOB|nr:DUF1289 domain-containing protein [Alloyangia pacifica]AWI83404.1 DUF1289 domain-containing protein [Alloyangia pacifica]
MGGPVETPCVNICVVHRESGLCTGCLRTLDEIAGWAGYTPEERRAIMQELPERKALLRQRRGGRAGRLKRES